MNETALLRNSYHGRLELWDQVFEELNGHGRCDLLNQLEKSGKSWQESRPN